MLKTASFYFHDSLQDFLLPVKRDTVISYTFDDTPAIKHAIETIGIPHPEVDIILVNAKPVDFFYLLEHNDIIEVFSSFDKEKFPREWSLTPPHVIPEKFILDVHLGKLARKLRLFGFDTLYENNYSDGAIVEISEKEERIILTRDKNLLKHKLVKWGYWLRSQYAEEQLTEVIHRIKPRAQFKFFERCVECNCKIEKIGKAEIINRLQPKTILYYNDFLQCPCCKRIYWKGSHYKQMQELIKKMEVKLSL